MQGKTKLLEQSVDEFLATEHSTATCLAIWEQLVNEVQNGDQGIAIRQAMRVAASTQNLWMKDNVFMQRSLSLIRAFMLALREHGIFDKDKDYSTSKMARIFREAAGVNVRGGS